MSFPADKDHLPGDWVDEGKLFLFIQSEVAFRAPRSGARLKAEKKRKAAAALPRDKKKWKMAGDAAAGEEGGVKAEDDDSDDSPEAAVKLRMNTIKGYVSAIMKLWSQQVSMGLHASPRPRGDSIKNLLDSLEREQYQRSRAEFADRGRDTIKDGYVPAQIPNVTKAAWAEGKKRSIEAALRTQVDFLFGNAMLLRQGNRLGLELADLFAMPLPKEGQDEKTWCLVAALLQGMIPPVLLHLLTFYLGKTNQHGRIEYGAALRHRDYQSCLIGALAVFFFWRWTHSGESFPVFRTSKDWYLKKVLKRDGDHLEDTLSKTTASAWTFRMYHDAGIEASKISHAPRQSGTRNAEEAGVTDPEVRRSFLLVRCLLLTISIASQGGPVELRRHDGMLPDGAPARLHACASGVRPAVPRQLLRPPRHRQASAVPASLCVARPGCLGRRPLRASCGEREGGGEPRGGGLLGASREAPRDLLTGEYFYFLRTKLTTTSRIPSSSAPTSPIIPYGIAPSSPPPSTPPSPRRCAGSARRRKRGTHTR